MLCNNCQEKEGYNIADGLCLCDICESSGQWRLVQHIETKQTYWKDIQNMAIVDEIIVD